MKLLQIGDVELADNGFGEQFRRGCFGRIDLQLEHIGGRAAGVGCN